MTARRPGQVRWSVFCFFLAPPSSQRVRQRGSRSVMPTFPRERGGRGDRKRKRGMGRRKGDVRGACGVHVCYGREIRVFLQRCPRYTNGMPLLFALNCFLFAFVQAGFGLISYVSRRRRGIGEAMEDLTCTFDLSSGASSWGGGQGREARYEILMKGTEGLSTARYQTTGWVRADLSKRASLSATGVRGSQVQEDGLQPARRSKPIVCSRSARWRLVHAPGGLLGVSPRSDGSGCRWWEEAKHPIRSRRRCRGHDPFWGMGVTSGIRSQCYHPIASATTSLRDGDNAVLVRTG